MLLRLPVSCRRKAGVAVPQGAAPPCSVFGGRTGRRSDGGMGGHPWSWPLNAKSPAAAPVSRRLRGNTIILTCDRNSTTMALHRDVHHVLR